MTRLIAERGITKAPAPSLYNVLGTHQRSKQHEIRVQNRRNLYVLEILKKGVFLHRKTRGFGKKKGVAFSA